MTPANPLYAIAAAGAVGLSCLVLLLSGGWALSLFPGSEDLEQ